MTRRSSQPFDAFCREAVDFLKSSATPYLVIGGIAVGAIGEPRATGDVDVIGYVPTEKAISLIDAAVAAGFRVASDEREKLQLTGTLRFLKGQFQLDIILASLPFEDDPATDPGGSAPVQGARGARQGSGGRGRRRSTTSRRARSQLSSRGDQGDLRARRGSRTSAAP